MSFDVFVWFDHRLGFPKTGFLQRIIGHIGYMGPYPSILRSFRSENTEEPSRTVGRHASGGVTQHQRGLLRFIGCVWRLSTQKGQRLTGGVASHFQRILSNGGQIRRLCDVGIIEPYDGDIFRNMQLLLAEFLDDCDCHLIGFGTDGGWHVWQ